MNPSDAIEMASKFTTAYPSISDEVVDELMCRGLLQCGGDCWRFGDENNGTTRRLNGQKFTRADNAGADWHKLIGLADVVHHNRKHVLFVIEGSKDALAAAELAFRFHILGEVGIICALGSGYRPIASELQQLRGRHVGLIVDLFIEPAEIYPNSEAWGSDAFTFTDKDAAFAKLRQMGFKR